MKKILPVFLTIVILFAVVFGFSISVVSAQTTTDNQTFSIPPTSEGPGFILPDSPFYFLDKIKQSVRLAFAVTPSQKAEVFSSVAGERFAELRFELIKNNIPAAEVAINGLKNNTASSAKEVANAKLWGADVTSLAGDVNQKIKEHLLILEVLEGQATGELKADVSVAIASLIDSKSRVENYLSKTEQDSELKDDLRRETIRSAQNTLNDVASLKNNLTLLQKSQETNITITQTKKSTTTNKVTSTALSSKTLTDVEDISSKAQNILDLVNSDLSLTTPTPTPISTKSKK